MKQKKIVQLAAVVFALVFVAGTTGLYAGTNAPDVIKMENKMYSKHTKGIVDFSHKKHTDEYKIGCGDCHHDEKGKKLTKLKAGDDVKSCAECHSKPGQAPKGSDAPKLKKNEKIQQYHAEAIHANCIDCHKDVKKKDKSKNAPTSCKDCHPKKGK